MIRRLAPALVFATAISLGSAASAQSPAAAEFRSGREGVLGTSCELIVGAADAAAAAKVEAAVLAEVHRLDAILSHHDDKSELRAAVTAGKPCKPSADLLAVLQACEQWRQRTHGAFHPGVEQLTALWQAAAKAQQPPGEAALAAVVQSLQQPAWTSAQGLVTFAMPVSLDALGKGYVLDRAVAAGNAAVPGARVLLLAIGGDLRLDAAAPRRIAVRDPRRPADNGEPLAHLRLQQGGVASSGGYRRGFQLGQAFHSHILDPRTGQPCDGVLGSTVVAADAVTADALSTCLCVLGAKDGLALLAASGAQGVLVTADGVVHASPGWAALVEPAPTPAPDSGPIGVDWPAGYELEVKFTIRGSAAGNSGRGGRGGWKRPYVAAWIEDPQGRPVRTLCLWFDSMRWLRDLQRYYRQYRDLPGFLDAVSQATRKAGEYTLVWDGKDDDRQPAGPGDYVLFLEAAREHGTYQLMRKPFRVTAKAFEERLEGNAEIEAATLRLHGKDAGK